MPGNFVHTERIALVDSHGKLRGYFDGLNQDTAELLWLRKLTVCENEFYETPEFFLCFFVGRHCRLPA
jgi:hypothetical protein